MKWWDYVLMIISAVCTIVSIVFAYKAAKYYKRTKDLTVYANTNIAYIEIEKIIMVFPELLKLSNKILNKSRSCAKAIADCGTKIKMSLIEIRKVLEPKDYALLDRLSNEDINVEKYIDSLISASILVDGNLEINDQFNNCQYVFYELQKDIKNIIEKLQEKLK